jgi:ADP-heptose:LPS heptosyltransferase
VTIVLHGMHGLGDNLHQRAIVRQLLEQDPDVYLESSWISPYHDLIERGLKIVHKSTALRTQTKNANRERDWFWRGPVPANARQLRNAYSSDQVRAAGSVLGGMFAQVGGLDLARADFRLPVPQEWHALASEIVAGASKPIMLYRPLVQRTEWNGAARNPDPTAYAELYRHLRDRFHVISIADLVPGREWIVGPEAEVDQAFHHGELVFETLAALTARAALVFASPGFAIVLAQATSTPSVAVFGGYESSWSFSAGARHSPYLGLDTLRPCSCFSSRCPGPDINRQMSRFHPERGKACDKAIEIPAAKKRIDAFVEQHTAAGDRPADAERGADRLARDAAHVPQSWRDGGPDRAAADGERRADARDRVQHWAHREGAAAQPARHPGLLRR